MLGWPLPELSASMAKALVYARALSTAEMLLSVLTARVEAARVAARRIFVTVLIILVV